MRLILTRHGETEENKKGILQGHLPGTLSKEGIEQTKKLALRLKDEKIDAIFSSDLKRAVDTTKEIAKFHQNIPITYTQELREGFPGKFQGLHESKFDWNQRSDDAETLQELQQRAKKFLDSVYDKYPGKTVLLIGHSGINVSIITVIQNRPAEDLPKIESLLNTSISIFEIKEDNNHKIHCLNCTKHLE